MITPLNILGILHISLSCVSIICCHKMAVMHNYNVQLSKYSIEICQLLFFLKRCVVGQLQTMLSKRFSCLPRKYGSLLVY